MMEISAMWLYSWMVGKEVLVGVLREGKGKIACKFWVRPLNFIIAFVNIIQIRAVLL